MEAIKTQHRLAALTFMYLNANALIRLSTQAFIYMYKRGCEPERARH